MPSTVMTMPAIPIVMSMMEAGLSQEKACRQFWLVDKDGLLATSRKGELLVFFLR